jgi:hypothetical protein
MLGAVKTQKIIQAILAGNRKGSMRKKPLIRRSNLISFSSKQQVYEGIINS